MHRRFSWDALNVTNTTQCGGDKCYFQGEREGEGWLVCWRSKVPLIQQSKAWAFAEELRAGFGVDHLMRGPPFLATLSHEQATHLNAKINISLDRRKPKDGAKPYHFAGPHPVQAVRSCSWPECVLLKCGVVHSIRPLGQNNPTTAQAIEGFVANAPIKTKLRLGIQQNFALVTAMIKSHPCLIYLRNHGKVLNIDLDRCKQNRSHTETKRQAHKTITLTTRSLRLTCRD